MLYPLWFLSRSVIRYSYLPVCVNVAKSKLSAKNSGIWLWPSNVSKPVTVLIGGTLKLPWMSLKTPLVKVSANASKGKSAFARIGPEAKSGDDPLGAPTSGTSMNARYTPVPLEYWSVVNCEAFRKPCAASPSASS